MKKIFNILWGIIKIPINICNFILGAIGVTIIAAGAIIYGVSMLINSPKEWIILFKELKNKLKDGNKDL